MLLSLCVCGMSTVHVFFFFCRFNIGSGECSGGIALLYMVAAIVRERHQQGTHSWAFTCQLRFELHYTCSRPPCICKSGLLCAKLLFSRAAALLTRWQQHHGLGCALHLTRPCAAVRRVDALSVSHVKPKAGYGRLVHDPTPKALSSRR